MLFNAIVMRKISLVWSAGARRGREEKNLVVTPRVTNLPGVPRTSLSLSKCHVLGISSVLGILGQLPWSTATPSRDQSRLVTSRFLRLVRNHK